jgi:hypothetical protein
LIDVCLSAASLELNEPDDLLLPELPEDLELEELFKLDLALVNVPEDFLEVESDWDCLLFFESVAKSPELLLLDDFVLFAKALSLVSVNLAITILTNKKGPSY